MVRFILKSRKRNNLKDLWIKLTIKWESSKWYQLIIRIKAKLNRTLKRIRIGGKIVE